MKKGAITTRLRDRRLGTFSTVSYLRRAAVDALSEVPKRIDRSAASAPGGSAAPCRRTPASPGTAECPRTLPPLRVRRCMQPEPSGRRREAIEHGAQVVDTALHVLLGMKDVPDPDVARGRGHELHQARGAFRGDGPIVEARLGADHGVHEGGIELVAARGLVDHVRETCRGSVRRPIERGAGWIRIPGRQGRFPKRCSPGGLLGRGSNAKHGDLAQVEGHLSVAVVRRHVREVTHAGSVSVLVDLATRRVRVGPRCAADDDGCDERTGRQTSEAAFSAHIVPLLPRAAPHAPHPTALLEHTAQRILSKARETKPILRSAYPLLDRHPSAQRDGGRRRRAAAFFASRRRPKSSLDPVAVR